MHVLFLSPAAQLGGAERCLVDFIAVLRDAEPQTKISLVSLAEGPLLEQAAALGADIEVVRPPPELARFGESANGFNRSTLFGQASSAAATARFLAVCGRAIARRRPDVVHSNGMKAHMLAGLLTPRRARLVVHLHDFVGSRPLSRRLLPALARLRPATVFAANSYAVAADFRAISWRADVRTIYNVVDVNYFAPGAADAPWLAAAAGLPLAALETVSFGMVATYARWKGHSVFIQAAGLLQAAHPTRALRFYVIGGPIYETPGSQVSSPELLALAQKAGVSGAFGLVPFQGDIARVYRSLNVVVHASIKPEPFGRTIVEAMACARPVVVSCAGGAAELFQHDENAVGFLPGSPVALAEAMANLLDESKRAALGIAARRHACSQFSRTRLAAELSALYRP